MVKEGALKLKDEIVAKSREQTFGNTTLSIAEIDLVTTKEDKVLAIKEETGMKEAHIQIKSLKESRIGTQQ